MAQNIRKMMLEHRPERPSLRKGHEARFEERLAKSFPTEKNDHSFFWLKIAAVGILLLSLGYFGYQELSSKNIVDTPLVDASDENNSKTQQFTLGDISPGLKKVEDFYMSGINVQLASLQITADNKELIDSYLLRINELDKEYLRLNDEMNKVGPSEETVTAMIDNLKLRLELLFKLKNKLKELKNLEDEQISNYEA